MPFTRHRLEEIREGTARARCTRCGQTWTSWHVRSACPGVPVYAYEETPPYLKTLTTLERERKYPPDPEHWDGAYRILKAPYYRLLYDERKAIHKPLSEKQLAAKEKQRQTMREKYGCRLCDTYYRKEDQHRFRDRVCQRCQHAAESWNQLIAWGHHMAQEAPLILDISTVPADRPISFLSQAPHMYYDRMNNHHLIDWWKAETFLLTGYQVLSLETGELVRAVEHIRDEEEIFYLRHLVSPQPSLIDPVPLVLMVSSVARDIAYQAAYSGVRAKGELNPNLELLPMGYDYHARTGRTWARILEAEGQGRTEREHLAFACETCGVIPEATESTARLLRRFVLHLAAQQPIELAGSQEAENLDAVV